MPLDISISENCATKRKVRVRLARTVSSGHLSKEYTHASMCTCVQMQSRDCMYALMQNEVEDGLWKAEDKREAKLTNEDADLQHKVEI